MEIKNTTLFKTMNLKKQNIWAVKISNSEHFNLIEDKEYSILKFNWDLFDELNINSISDISIAVAKKYPTKENQLIKSISSNIFNFSKLY